MSPTVLICDDALFMRNIIRKVMTTGGFQVVGEAATAAEAVDMYQELRPDLVTMDLMMPGEIGGIDAVREIIKRDALACVLMCSSVGQAELVTEAMTAGAKGYIVKPFQPAQLQDAAESALRI